MPYNKKYPVEGDYFIKYTENQEDRISNAIGEVEESMTSIDNVFVGNPLTSNSNLNDVKEVGAYYVPTSAIKDTIINAPSDLPNSGFRMDVFNNGANAYIQVLTSFSPSKPVTYTRAFNNGNWGEWNGGAMDFVVDYGSNANGSWEKWASGKLVQWGKTKEMITSISTSGNNYLFNNYEELTFPIPFIDVPEQILNGAVRTISVVWSLTRNVTNTKIEILLMGAMNSSSGVGYYKAIGRWK